MGIILAVGDAPAVAHLLRAPDMEGLSTVEMEVPALDAIDKEYETLRMVRQDAVYHHGWAHSRGDYKEAESHEKHVMEIDGKLDDLRRQYQAVEAGLLENFDGVTIDETLKNK
eukprot:CAMPEP_0171106604 /NCGR_PEP_ID=MMETSP0766_2-20121228/65116_1 /TAXON_ID=439317 /ORGANISM="Gambierdiscus australes, Strain CAWD 149" /LENGTH=112 /DNA_ID=CAMNT_0011567727 /DNA_START=109 /DNA_END=448 /DNA_ORIENTATION=-